MPPRLEVRGIVRMCNPASGVAAVRTDDGDYVVLTVASGGDVGPGDVLHGAFDATGGEAVRNLTRGRTINVYLLGVANLQKAKRLVDA